MILKNNSEFLDPCLWENVNTKKINDYADCPGMLFTLINKLDKPNYETI